KLRVTLQPGGGRGIVAEVVLPKAILTAPTNSRGSKPWPGPGARPPAELPAPHHGASPASPVAAAGLDAPHSLFEPLDLPDQDHVEPFSPHSASDNGYNGFEPAAPNGDEPRPGGVSFYPGDGDDDDSNPRRKIMEVTGEIVAEHPAEYTGPVALPMIRLDATPLSPEAPGTGRSNGSQPATDAPPSWPTSANGSRTSEPVAADSTRAPAMDETMELPIFREVESAWFKATTPPPRPADAQAPGETAEPTEPPASAASEWRGFAASSSMPAPDPAPPAEPVAESAPAEPEPEVGGSGLPQRRKIGKAPEPPVVPDFDPVGTRGDAEAPDSSWQTPADRGWQVAANIGNLESDDATDSGLPRRRPMERLIPGSVEVPDAGEPVIPKPRRDPEGVRGLLSAYHRGVQRGRGDGSR
ncbi:MAG TPA: hypothetical protein VE172_09015, partial [Stackebrandtia sp.]